jgi:hypothetical protein
MSSAKLGFGKIKKKFIAVTGNKKLQPAIFIAAIAVIGSVFVLLSQAATPVTSFQTEAGTRSGNVTTVTDATASAGSAVKFGTVTTGGGIPVVADFPTRDSVGPATDPTQVYTGDCYFGPSESGTVIDSKILNCDGEGIRFGDGVTGVVFRNSILRGGMVTMLSDMADDADSHPVVFTVEDSEIIQNVQSSSFPDRGVSASHFVIKRSLIQGSHSAVGGHNGATLIGNFITTDGTDTHQSGIRLLMNAVVRGNTITCKPVAIGGTQPLYDGSGCSAHGVFYREKMSGIKAPAYNLTIENNYFKRGTVGTTSQLAGPYYATRWIDCAEWTDCVGIRFTGNLFSLGEGTDGGEFPFYGGNVWSGNYWTDGQPASSGQGR